VSAGGESAKFGNCDKSPQLSDFHMVSDRDGNKALSSLVIVIIKSFSFHYNLALPRMTGKDGPSGRMAREYGHH
jgi:hypothetical protein